MINKFFLADDDWDDTELFIEALKGINASIEIDYAINGRDVFEKIHTLDNRPEIIFLDINMPVMNGWECLQKLKTESNFADVPVIMYSTSSSKIDGKKAIKNGALGFYEKPPNYLQLKEFLQIICSSSTGNLKNTLKNLDASKGHKVYVE